MNELRVIRKLGDTESLYDHEVLHNTFLLSRALITRVPKSYPAITEENVKHSLKSWIKRNPLLQATIHRTNTYEIKSSKYFVYTDKTPDEYTNLDMVELEDRLKWPEIVENELRTPLDNVNGPLWRMKVLKTPSDEKSDENEYIFVFTSHHAIADGRNCYDLMLQFLNILSAHLEKTTAEKEEEKVQEAKHCMEELVHDFQARSDYVSKPTEKSPAKFIHRIPDGIGNKENGLHGRMDYFSVDKVVLTRLLAKMKLKASQAKLTSLLMSILCLAYKKTCIAYEVTDIPMNSLQPCILASLREKLKVNALQMGVFSVAFNCMVEDELSEETVWTVAEKQTLLLHAKIRNNEDIECFKHLDNLIALISSGYEFAKNQETNFDFSNIGIMKNTREGSAIHILEHYVGMPSVENRFVAPFFNGLTTVNGNLCWALSFNEKIFSIQFIRDLKQAILRLINELAD